MNQAQSEVDTHNLAQTLLKHPAYIELVKKRRTVRWLMMICMMLVFFATLIVWAYFPEIMNIRFPAGSPFSLSIWATALVIFVAILLSGYYSLFLANKLDVLSDNLKREVFSNEK